MLVSLKMVTYESPLSVRNCSNVLRTNYIIYPSTSWSIKLFGVSSSKYSHPLKVNLNQHTSLSKQTSNANRLIDEYDHKSKYSHGAIKIYLSLSLKQQ